MKKDLQKMVLNEKLLGMFPYLGIDTRGRWFVMRNEGDTFPIEFVDDEEAGKKRIAELSPQNTIKQNQQP